MTLVLAMVGPESLWVVADRRLTDRGRIVSEDAGKLMFLDSGEDLSILAYAGVGATAQGTEPADWMSNALRGRKLALEESLATLAETLRREMPRHLAAFRTPEPSHTVVIPAFVEERPRIHTIDLALSADRRETMFRHDRRIDTAPSGVEYCPRFMIAGSGAAILRRDRSWRRPLGRLLKAYDGRLISSTTVADALAAMNLQVSEALPDGTVGPRCIVAWRNRRAGVHRGGGGHLTYTGLIRDDDTRPLPTISDGIDIRALLDTAAPFLMEQLTEMRHGEAAATTNVDELNAALTLLPEYPDERLR